MGGLRSLKSSLAASDSEALALPFQNDDGGLDDEEVDIFGHASDALTLY